MFIAIDIQYLAISLKYNKHQPISSKHIKTQQLFEQPTQLP